MRGLTAAQREFFKDSAIRKNGSLRVMYHGSNADFDEFTSPMNWFSASREYASEYGGNVRAFYLNCKHPFNAGDTFAPIYEWVVSNDDALADFMDVFNLGDDIDLIEPDDDYPEFAAASNRRELVFSKASKELMRKLGMGEGEFSELVGKVVGEYSDSFRDAEGSELRIDAITRSSDFKDLLVSKGYDSIEALEGAGDAYCVAAFNASDIKSIGNLKPTDSRKIDEDAEDDYADVGDMESVLKAFTTDYDDEGNAIPSECLASDLGDVYGLANGEAAEFAEERGYDVVPLGDGDYAIRRPRTREERLGEAGYSGRSMSNNAVDAYERGEKPLSKWTKDDILDCMDAIDPDKAEKAEGMSLADLRSKFLRRSSWHHTSMYYNRTDFYSFDEDAFDEWHGKAPERAPKGKGPGYAYKAMRATMDYLTWGGSLRHPKPYKHSIDGYVAEIGSFYVVFDEKGNETFRKKIGSNGTHVFGYDPDDAIYLDKNRNVVPAPKAESVVEAVGDRYKVKDSGRVGTSVAEYEGNVVLSFDGGKHKETFPSGGLEKYSPKEISFSHDYAKCTERFLKDYSEAKAKDPLGVASMQNRLLPMLSIVSPKDFALGRMSLLSSHVKHERDGMFALREGEGSGGQARAYFFIYDGHYVLYAFKIKKSGRADPQVLDYGVGLKRSMEKGKHVVDLVDWTDYNEASNQN